METNESPEAVAPAEVEEVETPETELTETTDWQAEAIKARRIASRLRNKLTRATEAKVETKPDTKPQVADKKQSDGLDYGMKAYLRSEGIEPTEFGFVEEQMQESGMSIEKLVSNPYFKTVLKERRDAKSIETATPRTTRGATENAKTSVDYWVQQGKLPEGPENLQLRRDVLNRRLEIEKNGNRFSDTPINMGQ